MALLEVPEISRPVRGRHVYVRPPEPIDFPSSEDLEEQVSETKRHLTLRTTLYLLLEEAFASRGAIGSEQFLYWDPQDPKKCLSPDVFVKLGVTNSYFDTWKVWERGAPDMAVEIVSKSDRPQDAWEVKFARYAASGVRELVRFDADAPTPSLAVWDRVDGDLVERAPGDPNLLECTSLGFWWALVPSDAGTMLRLARDREGKQLLPTPAEDRIRLRAELQEERRARSLAEHERMLADQRAQEEAAARRKVEEERAALTAENERLRAELARRG